MKNVGRIFSIIGGAIALVTGFGLIICGVCFLLINIPEVKELFLKGVQFVQDKSSVPFMDYVDYMIAASTISAIFEFVFAAVCFVGGGLSLSCHKSKSYVATIVLNVIGCFNTFAILGSIFGIIFDNKKEYSLIKTKKAEPYGSAFKVQKAL